MEELIMGVKMIKFLYVLTMEKLARVCRVS